MRYKLTEVNLETADKNILESWIRSSTTKQRMSFRARIILMASEGMGTNDIAKKLETRPATVTKWRVRFANGGSRGLIIASLNQQAAQQVL